MKKFIILLLSVVSVSHLVYGQRDVLSPEAVNAINQLPPAKQTNLDTAYLRILYRQLVIMDTINNNKPESHEMVLQIGNRLTKYWDFSQYTVDSLSDAYRKEGKTNVEIRSKTNGLTRGSTHEIIFSGMKEGYLTTSFSMFGKIMYEEKIPEINWRLEKDTLTVLGYQCRKATCRLFGRNYTAWYAPDIAIDKGPWKFSGLPGLILKASDDREQVFFDCYAMERIHWTDPVYFTEGKYTKSEKQAALKMYNDFKLNPGAYLESSGITVTAVTRDGAAAEPAPKKRYYNPIELENN